MNLIKLLKEAYANIDSMNKSRTSHHGVTEGLKQIEKAIQLAKRREVGGFGLVMTYDKEAHAFYIKLTDKKVAKTITVDEGTVHVDVDKDSKAVGIEILICCKCQQEIEDEENK